MNENVDPKEEKVILEALENPKYTWRTIEGIANETGLGADKVLDVITRKSDIVVRSSLLSKNGENLYTTRKHFQERSPIIHRILGAFKNRVD